jgi:hypothetical protein
MFSMLGNLRSPILEVIGLELKEIFNVLLKEIFALLTSVYK